MTAEAKKRALLVVGGLLLVVLIYRVFYFQELFFALLLFALGYLFLLLLVALAVVLWLIYARAVVYVAARAAEQGHRALPLLRVIALWLAPTMQSTAEAVSATQEILFYPFRGLAHGWLESFRVNASHFRQDDERAARHLNLLKHS